MLSVISGLVLDPDRRHEGKQKRGDRPAYDQQLGPAIEHSVAPRSRDGEQPAPSTQGDHTRGRKEPQRQTKDRGPDESSANVERGQSGSVRAPKDKSGESDARDTRDERVARGRPS